MEKLDDVEDDEQYDKEILFEKKFQKLEARIGRNEALIEKLSLKTDSDADSVDMLNRKIAFLEKNADKLGEEASRLANEEKIVLDLILERRRENDWRRLIMLDCPSKFFEAPELFCKISEKTCQIKGCPRINELDPILKKYHKN